MKSQHHIKTATLGVFDVRLQNLENTVSGQETRIKQLEDNASEKNASAAVPAAQEIAPAAPHSHPMIAAGTTPPASPMTATPGSAGEPERIAALEKEIAVLKSAAPLQDKDKLYHSIRLLSSFHRLSSKVLSGKPFAKELSEFEDLTGEDAALDKPIAAISPYADSGVPTYAVLLASFDEAMEGIRADDAAPPAGATLWQRIVYNFTHMITVRRIDEAQKGNSVPAILGRAQAHLDVQETQAAITEIAALPDDARSHFTSWLEDAQMATQAADLMDQVEENVMQKAFYTESITPAADTPAAQTPAAPQAASPDTPPAVQPSAPPDAPQPVPSDIAPAAPKDK